ncbi:MAG TPA: ATP-binding protein [Gammaproteobacteria bacterium]|nr:ATP-binding protein [Gammaproteobacteria bacterium]
MLTIKEKLLVSFFCLSLLIFLVSMVFYNQLKILILPLTPQSIPQNVDLLGSTIDKNDLIFKLLYQQLLVSYNFENYIFTKQTSLLQEYYASDSDLDRIINEVKNFDLNFPKELDNQLQLHENERVNILKIKQNINVPLIDLINPNSNYSKIKNNIRDLINHYYRQDQSSREQAIVSVKLSVKNATEKLRSSLNTTLVIFFDAIIASIVLTVISSRSISQPINLLKENIEREGMENLSIPIDPQLLSLQGEIGDLARSFDKLINRLRSTTVLRDELLNEIKHRKKIEKELRRTAVNLHESNRALDQFAYIASHDLRAPLRAIENLTEWIQEDSYKQLSAKSRNHLDLLKKRVRRLDMLIGGILEYSRAGIVSKEEQIIDMKKIVADVIDNLSPPTHINIAIDSDLPVITCNKIAITQVFLNLIGNAIKFIDKPNGLIHIGYKQIPQYYQFYVADNGPGIEPQFHEKIFDVFQTLQSRDTTDSSGLGLAIVKRIVEKNGGRVWLTSELVKGTTFYFTWPQL